VATHPDAPHLAHQPALALTYQLIQFREGRRRGGGMELNAAHLSDQDMKDLSAYLSQLPPPPKEETADRDAVQEGAEISNAFYCNSCHGRALEGQKHIPALARQKSTYLFRQLQHFKSGERIDLDGSMENAVQGLDERAMHRLSTYAASH
jgi:cytochrome c553